jgi:RHS repeat-associated protein
MASKDNNYLYNHKELNADHDLKWYDYGARFYDAVIWSWHVVDPMGERTPSWSPYNYVGNNSLVKHDPSGM